MASDANVNAWGMLKFSRAKAEVLSEGWRVWGQVEEHVFDRVTAFTAGANSTDHLLGPKRLQHLGDCRVAGDLDGLKESLIFKPVVPLALEKYAGSLLISSTMKIVRSLGLNSCFKIKQTMSEC